MPRGEEKDGLMDNIINLLKPAVAFTPHILEGLKKMNTHELQCLYATMKNRRVILKPFEHEEGF